MSGIAGVVRFDGPPVEPGLVERMTSAIASRGPDGIGHWTAGGVALGQCMLRTTPESLEEKQPLANEDAGLVLVMDGRLDNYEELRQTLLGRGAVLRDRSDAELALRAYEAWGDDCADRLVGEFVLVVWDARRRCLYGARDAAGTRHFHYHAGRGWFAFASEIRALLATGGIERRLNEARLLDYVVVEFDRDDQVGTFYQGIERLPAGHAMRVTEGGVETWRYWNPDTLPELPFRSREECSEAFVEHLRTAVRCRLRSNGPVGAMLSGGLDSSSIVGLIRSNLRACLAQPLRTFSLVREERAKCEDWRGIQNVLAQGWVEPTVIGAAAARDVWRAYLDSVADLNEPFGLSGAFTFALVYEAARKAGCRVVLDGMAGDLMFYSFARSLAHPVRVARHIPAILAAGLRHGVAAQLIPVVRGLAAAAAPKSIRTLYRSLRDPHSFPLAGLGLLHRETARRLLVRKDAQRDRERLSAPSGDRAEHARNFTSGMLSFAHEVVGEFALGRGVEPRSPFSDRRVIELAVRMPIEAKVSAHWYKATLREGMRDILPEEVRWRRDLASHPGWDFYRVLFEEWARGAPEIWNLASLQSRLGEWIDGARLAQTWQRYRETRDHAAGLEIFSLVVLARWLDTHFDAVPPGSTHGYEA